MRWRHRLRGVGLAAILVLLTGAVVAEERAAEKPASARPVKPLAAKLTWHLPRARLQAPMGVDLEFDYQGQKLLEGRPRLRFLDGREVLGEYVGPELALTAGKQAFRLLLPWQDALMRGVQVDVDMTWLGPEGEIPIGSSPLLLPDWAQRTVALCLAVPEGRFAERHTRLLQSLRLERFRPRKDVPDMSLMTQIAHHDPNGMPTDPIMYCSYDLVLLPGEGFSDLDEKPLGALRQWVDAGGSVCVIPDTPVSRAHVDFLNGLTGAHEPPYATDAKGMVTGAGGASSGIACFYCSLGRAVIVTGMRADAPTFDGPAGRRAVAFLWKVTAAQMSAVIDKEEWREDLEGNALADENRYQSRNLRPDSNTARLSMRVTPMPAQGELVRFLIPRTIRLVPFWLIVLLLAAFVVVIGPVDYFGLGLIRRRRYTWVFFPAVCGAFMLIMVFVSRHYMGTTDRVETLALVDVGADGRPVRRTTFEVVFASGNQTRTTTEQNCLFAALGATSNAAYPPRSYGYEPQRAAHVRVAGRVPSEYQVVQEIRQWTPQLNRRMTIGKLETKTKLNWDAVDAKLLQGDARQTLPEKLGLPRDSGAIIFVCHQREPLWRLWLRHSNSGASPEGILYQVTVWPQGGFLSIVSQVSPSGGSSGEDLAILDPTDPRQWLVMAAVEEKEGWVVYRKVYVEP